MARRGRDSTRRGDREDADVLLEGWLLLGNKNAAKESFLQRPCSMLLPPPILQSSNLRRCEARRGLRAELLRSTSRTGLRAHATHRSDVRALERQSTKE
eukprot:symbB.v1.2.025315.t1/scaffold2450.1/size78879/11